MSENKSIFRSICMEYLPHFKQVQLPMITKNKYYEAVLVEFRVLPHVELLIRNAILKLGSDWSFTIVCGNENHQMFIDMVTEMRREIKIIKLEKENITINDYNLLLLSVEFWTLFVGNKILIYQEDSYIFHSMIHSFLQYDYVGAPWQHLKDYCEVGNGGFSLRNKQIMIQILRKYRNRMFTDLPICVQNDIAEKGFTVVPEDLFFSRIMKINRIGKVPLKNVAIQFSIEGYTSSVIPFGGHQFWYALSNWNTFLRKNIFTTITKYYKR
jgi:hypothetical protein